MTKNLKFWWQKSTINLAKNTMVHGRCKHIETKFHFLSDQVNEVKTNLPYFNSYDEVTYVLTIPLKIEKFKEMRKMLNVFSL